MSVQKPALKNKISLFILGVFFTIAVLEVTLRLGGSISVYLRDYRNNASLRQNKNYTIICLGESTTFGVGADAYPQQLEQILNNRYPGIKFSVINKGMNGIDSTYILSMLKKNVLRYHPNMVIAMIGINDHGIKYYEGITDVKSPLFNNFRVYKFFRILAKQLTERRTHEVYRPFEDSFPVMEKKLKEVIKNNPRDVDALVALGWRYVVQLKYDEAGDLFKKALEIDPGNDKVYAALGWYYYCTTQKNNLAVEYFQKALLLNPLNIGTYNGLAFYYKDKKNFAMSEACFKKIIQLEPRSCAGYIDLGYLYLLLGRKKDAEALFKKATTINNCKDWLYRGLSTVYREMGNEELCREYTRIVSKMGNELYQVTALNYQKIKEFLDKEGITLVVVQYPVRSIEPLKRCFDEKQGVLFVDNEKIFKDALKNGNYATYFADLFGGDFGHCTRLGYRLLAGNIADTLTKEYFDRRIKASHQPD
jgi:tetratricopeptide (TPR) repeat protein